MDPERWRKIEALYEAARGVDAARRDAVLEEGCGGDQSLRHEVESLLAHGENAGRFLEVPAVEMLPEAARPAVGQQVSHYEIQEKLGEGGMGVVYKAEDTRLDRTVALKFLSSHLLESDEARERFVREAKAAATLDHPNICTVYEIGEADGETFLSMAYIEGPTLKQKIDERPLKLKQALDFAIQIGQGLQAAHEHGIIHRDIKPANLMLSADGQVKVMDFGLAHLGGRTKITKTGVVLGTPSYMAPEQLRGEQTDRRADIWSFGVVLHEMITGQPPFEGETEETLSYAILHDEPEPLTALRSGVPVELDRVVAKLLAKDPDERYQHLDEALVDLRTLRKRLPETSKTRTAGVPVSAGARQVRLPWVLIAALTALLTVSLWAPWRDGEVAEPLTARLSMEVPGGCELSGGAPIAVAPDGTAVMFAAACNGTTQLHLRRMNEYTVQPVSGTNGAVQPFFSPDGGWVGFFAGGQLRKVPATGGEASTICDVGKYPHGGSWSKDGTIVFSPDPVSGLRVVPDSGGIPKNLTTPKTEREVGHWFPQVLPGGRGVIFTIGQFGLGYSQHPVAVLDMKSGEYRVLIEDSTFARFAESGHIIHYRRGTLIASAFDENELRLAGTPTRLIDNVSGGAQEGAGFALSRTGTLVYAPSSQRRSRFVWIDRDGKVEPLPIEPQWFEWLDLSPDGTQLVTTIRTGPEESDVWVYDVERGTRSRVTSDGTSHAPIRTRDGEAVVFASSRGGPAANLHRKHVDQQGEAESLHRSILHQDPACLGPDGEVLVFVQYARDTSWDIWTLNIGSGGEPRPFIQSRFGDMSPALSPDGRWLAYASDESGRPEVYVQPFPQGGRRWQVSSDGGRGPLWSPDGKEIFYWSGDRLMAASVSGQVEFRTEKPRFLLTFLYSQSGPGHPNYDVAPDGRRFLIPQPVEEDFKPIGQIRVVLNWTEAFRQPHSVHD